MLVSVVTPTYDRAPLLPALHACWLAQSHAEREWVVLDDSPLPSPFMASVSARDPRIRYHHLPVRMSLGEKRNWLVEAARGEVVAHFDDDDHYGPLYLSFMLERLGTAALVKLAGFFVYASGAGDPVFAYWDTRTLARLHWRLEPEGAPEPEFTIGVSPERLEAFSHRNLYGYGFSNVYRRDVARRIGFPAIGHGEDYQFVRALLGAGEEVRLIDDCAGVALAIRHPRCSSVLFPQFLLPAALLDHFFPDVRR
jgi:glycosyltransferase involved in cell wall biosynthesis